MAKDDDEQTKNGDVAKTADQAKAARDDASAKTDDDSDDADAKDDDSDEGDDADADDEKDEGDDSDEDDSDESEDPDEDAHEPGEAASKDEDHEEDEDEDEPHVAAAPKPEPSKSTPAADAAAAKESSRKARLATRSGHAGLARPVPIEAPAPPPPPVASMGKRVFIFAILLVGLSVGLYFLPQSESAANGPRFKVPSTNDLTITVVPEDATALACASKQEVAGRKCEFGTKTEKNDNLDDMKMLKPYTTVDGVQFLAAGLWSQPVVEKSKLPSSGTRFGLKCKYVVEGIVKAPFIRWNPAQAWADKNPDWNAGYLKDCTVVPIEK